MMQKFYKKALLALVLLIVVDALLAAFFISRSYLSLSVLAAHEDGTRWRYVGNTDASRGGRSTVHIDDPDGERLRFDFRVTESGDYPFAAAELRLYDKNNRLAQVDWSKYTSATFLAKCAPTNSLIFAILSFDDKISKVGEFDTYRMPQSFFSCNASGVPVSVDLTRLTIPEWWFNLHKIPMSLQDYKLNKVTKVVFGASIQSPRNVDSIVEISEFTLHGRDYRYIAALVAILLVGAIIFGVWFFRAHSRALIASLESRMKRDLPLVAYRQLTLEPHKDKEKASLLKFIATNYTNADLDLEGVAAATGMNRNKINSFLKAELGLTFTGYVNKLRLTEAARLLAEKNGAAVSEIAYSVGYGNVPYFNKLFKEEYGCAPKAFRSLSSQQGQPPEGSSS
jgi:AraC-like DNA-binding protein